MTDEIRERAVIRVEKGEKVYSHQQLVQLYMKYENLSPQEAIDAVDFDMSIYKIEYEQVDWTKTDWTKL